MWLLSLLFAAVLGGAGFEAALAAAEPGGSAGKPSAEAGQSGPASSGGRGVTLLLQLTDVHISGLQGDLQRAPDLHRLAAELLARWPLAAALVTGDLTEARDKYGKGLQNEDEWRSYQDAWRALSALGGVPAGRIFDIRGNHDTFDTGSRCGPRDHFCRYSARADFSKAGVAAGGQAPLGGVGAATVIPGPADRVFIDPVYGSLARISGRAAAAGNSSSAAAGAGAGLGADGGCPALVLVGVDASLAPGLRSPTNFLGVLRQSTLEQLDQRLAAFTNQLHSAGCTDVPYISYGHYPLSTVGNPVGAASSLKQVLLRRGVSTYLCGHLHAVFGLRLHRLHLALTEPQGADGGAAACASGPGRGAAPHSGAPAPLGTKGHLAELESADWKNGRVLRLLTVDGAGGGVLSFADLRFRPGPDAATAGSQSPPFGGQGPALPVEPAGAPLPPLEPADPTDTREIGSYLPLITCPPDARYSPLLRPPHQGPGSTMSGAGGTVGCGGMPEAFGGDPAGGNGGGKDAAAGAAATAFVRVLILPVAPGAAAAPASVLLHWACGGLETYGVHLNLRRPGAAAAAGAAVGRELRVKAWPEQAKHEATPQGPAMGRLLRQDAEGGPDVGQQQQEQEHGAAGGGGRPDHRAQDGPLHGSGRVQMRLEFATANYSIFVADLLESPVRHAGDDGGGHMPAAEAASMHHCAAGLVSVQVVVGGDGSNRVGSGPSASEVRPLHWRPPPPSALPASSQSSGPLGGAVAASASGQAKGVNGPTSAAIARAQPALASLPADATDPSGWCLASDAFACAAAAGPPPAPLGVSTLEWLVLRVAWYRFGLGAFAAQWALLVGAALLAGLLASCGAGSAGDREGSRCREMATLTTLTGAAADEGGLSAVAAGGGGAGSGGRLLGEGAADPGAVRQLSASAGPSPRGPRRSCSGGDQAAPAAARRPPAAPERQHRPPLLLRLWPLCDFAALARQRPGPWPHGPWVALLSYWAYLAVGPWLLAEFVSGEGPGPAAGTGRGDISGLGGGASASVMPAGGRRTSYGVMTAYGIFMPFEMQPGTPWRPAPWTTAPSLDFAVICNAVWLLNIAPAGLLCASAAARLRGLAAAGQLQHGRGDAAAGAVQPTAAQRVLAVAALSAPQAAALMAIGLSNLLLCWKLRVGLGWAPVLVSPGVGWLLPLTVAWLWWVRRCAVACAAAAPGSAERTAGAGGQRWEE